MPAVGEPAPDFTLPDQDGRPVTLSALRGRTVILYFYPKDDTPGCTSQACEFRDADAEIRHAGATVLGVSPDGPADHAKFAAKFGLPFRLLADTEQGVCQLYGVWKERSMYGKKFLGVERTTFVIDPGGVIARVFPRVKVANHVAAVLEAATAAGREPKS